MEVFQGAERPPITTADLLPPRIANPKPWQRIAVMPINPSLGSRKIWKRVAGVVPSLGDCKFSATLSELQRQGSGPRKHARVAAHVPPFGDARWDQRADNPIDDKAGLEKARVLVAATSTRTDISKVILKAATFDENRLRIVPRKRCSNRVPIDSPSENTPQTARQQSPVKPELSSTEVAAAAACVGAEQAESKQVRRKLRRLSRRMSLMPISEAIGEKPAIVVSPGKKALHYCTPMRRRPMIKLTAAKLATSPVKPFTISATPTKVILEEPEPTGEANFPALSAGREEPAVLEEPFLLFDQPTSEVLPEPEYETKRRQSLHKARRSERRSSSVRHFLDLDTQNVPKRRLSFMPGEVKLTSSRARRHTFGAAMAADQHMSLDLSASTGAELVLQTDGKAEHAVGKTTLEESRIGANDSAVDVDVRTNLDIFGLGHVGAGGRADALSTTHKSSLEFTVGKAEDVASCSLAEIDEDNKPPKDALGILSLQGGLSRNTTAEQTVISASLTSPVKPLDAPHCLPFTPELCLPGTAGHGDGNFEESPIPTIPVELSASSPRLGLMVSSDYAATRLSSQLDHEDDCTSMATITKWSSPAIEELTKSRTTNVLEPRILNEASDLLPLSNPDVADSTSTFDVDADEECSSVSSGLEDATLDVAETASFDACIDDDEQFLQEETLDQRSNATVCETPPQAAYHDKVPPGHRLFTEDNVLDTPTQATGFTPINNRSSLSPRSVSPVTFQDDSNTITSIDVDPSFRDYNATVEMDFAPEAPTEKRLSSHDDSETEMLRKFVTRVKADKTAKAAAAAYNKSQPRPKRRSGSMGSTTAASGSPLSKKDLTPTAALRMPLSQKDHNMSPSPIKKRKFGDQPSKESLLSKPSLDDTSPPRPKRRRKKMEADTGGIYNPEFLQGQKEEGTELEPPRRSTRTRNNRLPLKSASSAANTALSSIPVRLPGSLNLSPEDNFGLPNLGARRNEEKDLAAVTRVNTRKNKGGSEHPSVVLARQTQDPSWRMKELRSVLEAREAAATITGAEGGGTDKNGRRKGPKPDAKEVRWAEVLVRFQGDDNEPVVRKSTIELLGETVGVDMETADMEKETLEFIEPVVAIAVEPTTATKVEAPKRSTAKEEKTIAAPRRTRASRLQPPTPSKALAAAAKAAAASEKAASAALPTKTPPGSMARMATRRTKISGLGMSGNGTPAPKRRATRA